MTKVAVYGSLRKGLGNHRILEGAVFEKSTTLSGNYRMVSLSGFPGVLESSDVDDNPIVVEVYSFEDEAIMQRLDRLEGYRGEGENNFYDRINVTLDDGTEALMYTLPESEYGSLPRVVGGDWKEYRIGKL